MLGRNSNSNRRSLRLSATVLATTVVAAGVGTAAGASSASAASSTVRIDSGGSKTTDSRGSSWSADTGWSGGSSSTALRRPVAGTTDDRLYQSQRVGVTGYHVPLDQAGTYKVRMLFAEPYWTSKGKRSFSVTAEGGTVVDRLDLVAASGGRNTALDRTAEVEVTDGALDLAFSAQKDQATISGLEITLVTASGAATTPTPSARGLAASTVDSTKLSWKPPGLSSPTTIVVRDGQGDIDLDDGKDYVVDLPDDRAVRLSNGLNLYGGRNVVVIGGTVDVRNGDSGGSRRGMYLKGQTGTVHVEGVKLVSSTRGTLTEGIDLDERKGAKVVLQNIWIDELSGSKSTNHADVIQTWSGPRVLDVDGLQATTSYQGLFLLPNQYEPDVEPQTWTLRRVAITGTETSKYLLWKDHSTRYVVDDVHLLAQGREDWRVSKYTWPADDAAWKKVIAGPVPDEYASTAGTGYRSPGYK